MDQQENFTEEDLLLSESFHNWVKKQNPTDILFWEAWLSKYPEKRVVAQRARSIILGLSPEEANVAQQEISQAWVQLQQTLQQRKSSGSTINATSAPSGTKVLRWWYAVAAVFLGLCISGFIAWKILMADKLSEFSTGFGETKAIILPDGSQVSLNGNTRLSYKAEWSAQEDREVWLNGEAYFSVTQSVKKGNKKFIVHTEKLDVEVIGTQFNVSNRQKGTQVVLNEGQVKVNPKKEAKAVPMIMKPGELLEYSSTQQTIIKKVANPQMYSSWKFKKMMFEETSLQEIAERIEATYGYKVIFADTALAARKLTGTIPSDNIDVLLLTLSKLFNLNIGKEQNQIIIKSIT
jgi:ferric-dicitrate binding protein FerR (iron transport regulator)